MRFGFISFKRRFCVPQASDHIFLRELVIDQSFPLKFEGDQFAITKIGGDI